MIQDTVDRDARLPARSDQGRRRNALAELKAKGMQFNEIAPAEIERMRDATKPVVAKFSADHDPAKVKLFNAELARIRGSVK